MFNPQLLAGALSDPTIAVLSDADAATALSAPIYAPNPNAITYATLGAAWGPTAAASFTAALTAAIAAGNALAIYVDKLLGGTGFDATNAYAAPTAAQLVTAGLCTAQQVQGVLYLPPTYRCGDVVQASDVTTARAAIAFQNSLNAIKQQWASAYNKGVAILDALSVGSAVPTLSQLTVEAQS